MMHLRNIVLALIGIYCAALIALFVAQRSLLFPASGGYIALAEAGAPAHMREIAIATDDGLTLKAWYAPATTQRFTIVMFHGNADDMRNFLRSFVPFVAAGYGLMLTEYRGYFGMPGSPSETALYADARANLRVLERQGVAPERMILYGHSLGTGIATRMAREFPVAGVALSAPYTAVADVAARRYPLFPVRLMMRDRFENENGVRNIHTPLLILHGAQDSVIPVANAEAVYAAASEPKTLKIFPDAGHNDMVASGLIQEMLDWMNGLRQE